MSVSRKFFLNVATSSISKILGTVLALVGIGLITRYLGQESFGLYITALAFFMFFNSFGDLGLYQTTAREISQADAKEKDILSKGLGLRFASCLLIIISTPFLIYNLPYSSELKIGIFITSWAFLFSASYQFLIGIFQKRLEMPKIALIEFFGKIVQVGTVFLAVKFDLGFSMIVSSLLFSMIFNFLATFFYSQKLVRFSPEIDLKYWKSFAIKSFPLGLSIMITFAYFKADSIILSFFHPAKAVGIYGAAYKIIENLSFFPGMIVGLTMPMFAHSVFVDRKRFERIANANFKFFLILSVPLMVGTFFLASDIIRLIAGNGFEDSVLVLKIVIVSMSLIFFGQFFNSILIASNFQKDLFKILLFCAFFSIGLNLIFIPKFSYLATSLVSVSTEFLVSILGFLTVKRKLNFSPKMEGLTGIILSSLLMGVFLFASKEFNFFMRFLLSPIVYFIALVFFKVLKKEEVFQFLRKSV